MTDPQAYTRAERGYIAAALAHAQAQKKPADQRADKSTKEVARAR